MSNPEDTLQGLFEDAAERDLTPAELATLKMETDAWRKTMEPATKKTLYEADHEHNKVMDPGKGSESFANILKGWNNAQFAHGAATLNRLMPDGSTRHYTLRMWLRKLMACPTCQRVREFTIALADDAWITHCYVNCGFVFTEIGSDTEQVLQTLAEKRRLGLRL